MGQIRLFSPFNPPTQKQFLRASWASLDTYSQGLSCKYMASHDILYILGFIEEIWNLDTSSIVDSTYSHSSHPSSWYKDFANSPYQQKCTSNFTSFKVNSPILGHSPLQISGIPQSVSTQFHWPFTLVCVLHSVEKASIQSFYTESSSMIFKVCLFVQPWSITSIKTLSDLYAACHTQALSKQRDDTFISTIDLHE